LPWGTSCYGPIFCNHRHLGFAPWCSRKQLLFVYQAGRSCREKTALQQNDGRTVSLPHSAWWPPHLLQI